VFVRKDTRYESDVEGDLGVELLLFAINLYLDLSMR
jgi:hypothetical protein